MEIPVPVVAISKDTPRRNPAPPGTLRIMTCNILLDLPEQTKLESWEKHRREACFHVIRHHQPDIFCLQEVGQRQFEEFEQEFPEFQSYGFRDAASDRHPPRFKAIRNVIYFSTQKFELTAASGYWFSATPLVAASHLPGEKLGRQINWVRLREKASGREFRVLDTHLGLDQPGRIKQTAMIVDETTQYDASFPQILCGDLNSEIQSPELQALVRAGWVDTYGKLHPEARPTPERPNPPRKIDFIMARGTVEVVDSQLINNTWKSVRPSDHPFVSADLRVAGGDVGRLDQP